MQWASLLYFSYICITELHGPKCYPQSYWVYIYEVLSAGYIDLSPFDTQHLTLSILSLNYKANVWIFLINRAAFCDCCTASLKNIYYLHLLLYAIHWENDTSLWDDFHMEQLGKCIYNAWKVKQQFRELWLTAENFEAIILIFLE